MPHTRAVLQAAIIVALLNSAAAAQESAGQAAGTNNVDVSTASQDDRGFIRKLRQWAERMHIAERLSGDLDGWYPRLGGMTRGSGFSLGPGYRFHLDDTFVDLAAGYSIRNYKAVDAKVRWLRAYDNRFELWTNYRFEDFPQEDFFGVGSDSAQDARTSYDFDSSEVSVHGLFNVTPWLRVGTTLGYISPDIGSGSDDRFPSIEEVFTDATAPGLTKQPNFLHTTFFADVDYRDEPGNPRSGGFYHAGFGLWNDRTLEQFDFKRFDGNFWQFIPLVADKTHVLAGHVGVSYVNNATGDRVPFYFLPYVGGVDTIRSFHEFRFKDENALWMSAEYRWIPIEHISFAAFVDAGKVSADYQDINPNGLKQGYGVGVRVHTRRQTFARLDFGTGGGEGWKVFLKLGPGF